MPKLNDIQIADRLQNKLEDLRNGKEVSARDLRALLTEEQRTMLDSAWQAQQELRKKKRARTREQEQELGWRSKRVIQIEVLEQLLEQANDQMLEVLIELQNKAEVRQARIYLDSYFKSRDFGKTEAEAQSIANNDLTRAGLRRVDNRAVGRITERDRAVWEMESQLRGRQKAEMSAEELEQIELLEAHNRAWANKQKKQKKQK